MVILRLKYFVLLNEIIFHINVKLPDSDGCSVLTLVKSRFAETILNDRPLQL